MDSDEDQNHNLFFKKLVHKSVAEIKSTYTPKMVLSILLGTAILSFALHNIHVQANITEGGTFGIVLLLNHWLGLPIFLLTPMIDIGLSIIAAFFLGKQFIKISLVATFSTAIFLRIFASLPYLLPNLSNYPLLAALVGGIAVGGGAGLVFRQGGSCGGDDALVATVCKLSGWRIAIVYAVLDITVLLLALTYIAPSRIIFSVITAVTSSVALDVVRLVKWPVRLPEKPASKPLVKLDTTLSHKEYHKSFTD